MNSSLFLLTSTEHTLGTGASRSAVARCRNQRRRIAWVMGGVPPEFVRHLVEVVHLGFFDLAQEGVYVFLRDVVLLVDVQEVVDGVDGFIVVGVGLALGFADALVEGHRESSEAHFILVADNQMFSQDSLEN